MLSGTPRSRRQQVESKPLDKGGVLALVAGGALNENLINLIKLRGLEFKPQEIYLSQLKQAGATDSVVAAVDGAKIVIIPGKAGDEQDASFYQHLAKGAEFMRNKRYTDAAAELNISLSTHSNDDAVGFVMGSLLCKQERWAEAAEIYHKVAANDPEFPEVHTKLAFSLYKLGDVEQAIAEARTALKSTGENAEAHKILGLAWESERKYDAAAAEYREALRIKPDYALVHFDIGILYTDRRDIENAVQEYKKAIALEPGNAVYHDNLGFVLRKGGDPDAAIREFREAKRLDPNFLKARNDLARVLEDRDLDAAIVEFRELEAAAPGFELCHVCFGSALYKKGDLVDAGDQYRRALKLDPSDADAHSGLGLIFEKQGNYPAAISEYETAQKLDPDSVLGHKGLGRIFLARKEFSNASQELKRAETLEPTQWQIHDLLAQALLGAGEYGEAEAEYKEALQLWPKNAVVMAKLAELLEKKEDFIGALEQYRRAAEIQRDALSQNQYQAAETRTKAHIEALKNAGKRAEATELESRLAALNAVAEDPESKWQTTVAAALKILGPGHFDEAQELMRSAVSLAEKLQPREYRLIRTLGQLGGVYESGKKFVEATAAYQRQLTVTTEIYGPQSPENESRSPNWATILCFKTTTSPPSGITCVPLS